MLVQIKSKVVVETKAISGNCRKCAGKLRIYEGKKYCNRCGNQNGER